MFEPENVMTSLSGDMILPKFGEYKYNNMEKGTKPEHILFGFAILLLFLRRDSNVN